MQRLVCGDSSLPLHMALARKCWAAVMELCEREAATGMELHNKFKQEGAGFTLAFGGLRTFFGGLEKLVGAPDAKLEGALYADHCKHEDSDLDFVTSNYEACGFPPIGSRLTLPVTAIGPRSNVGEDPAPAPAPLYHCPPPPAAADDHHLSHRMVVCIQPRSRSRSRAENPLIPRREGWDTA